MFNNILKEIKINILEHCTPNKFIIIGSNKDGIINNTDLDIIIIVEDQTNLPHIIKNISPSIKKLIVKYNFYISVFPIKEKHYKMQKSEFIHNIRQTGIEF